MIKFFLDQEAFTCMCNIPKIHIKKSLALKIIFKIYFKNYKSFDLYSISI